MASNWSVLTPGDVRAVLSEPMVEKANSIGAGDVTTRLEALISMVTERVRGVIRASSRNTVSGTKGSVPPEAKQHAAILVARALINSVPTMAAAVETSTEWSSYVGKAESWLDAVKGGMRVTPPTDPEQSLSGPKFGSQFVHQDLTTD